MRFLLLFFIVIQGSFLYSQDTIKIQSARRFINLNDYKKLVGKPSDSSELVFRNGDTLVRIADDFDPFAYAGFKVRVKYEYKDSTFLSIYKNVVFNLGKKGSENQRMRYWKDDIKIFFDKSVPNHHANELMDFANKASKGIDSLNISRNFIRDKANYIVYYLNQENLKDYEPRIANSKGGYYISWNGKQQIYDGKLKINTELVETEMFQLELLKYHFIKSLGYFKSSEQLDCESYFSGCRTTRELTDIDLEILKYHYSYGVCKGTDLESFTELTNSMNKKLEADPNAQLYVVHHE